MSLLDIHHNEKCSSYVMDLLFIYIYILITDTMAGVWVVIINSMKIQIIIIITTHLCLKLRSKSNLSFLYFLFLFAQICVSFQSLFFSISLSTQKLKNWCYNSVLLLFENLWVWDRKFWSSLIIIQTGDEKGPTQKKTQKKACRSF